MKLAHSCMLSQQLATNISKNDRVILYPSFGGLSADGQTWRIPLQGTICELGDPCRRKRLWLELLQRLHKFHPSGDQQTTFEQRVQAFVAPTSRGKRMAIRIGQHLYSPTKRTDRNGVLVDALELRATDVEELEECGQIVDGWLQLEVVDSAGEPTGFHGMCRLLPPHGHSVISDIDDTIKITHVACRRSLLENTFLRRFEAVEGMAEVYSRWAEVGAAFHYVSSSPWQLFAPLSELFEQAGVPLGAFHLSAFTFQNHVLHRVWMLRKRAKLNVLKQVLQSFPERRFVLVGDSGERDPELYGALARRFPKQISKIYVRELPHRLMSRERCELAFRKLDSRFVQVFREAHELPRTFES